MDVPASESNLKLRTLLLNAALEILEEQETPFELRKIAERAGKSRTAPYLVFGKGKEGGLRALKLAVAAEGTAQLHHGLKRAQESSTDPRIAFRSAVEAFLTFADERDRLFRLMFGPEVAEAEGLPPDHSELERLTIARTELELVLFALIEPFGTSEETVQRLMRVWTAIHGTAVLMRDPVYREKMRMFFRGPRDYANLATEISLGTSTSSEGLKKAAECLLRARKMRRKASAGSDKRAPPPSSAPPDSPMMVDSFPFSGDTEDESGHGTIERKWEEFEEDMYDDALAFTSPDPAGDPGSPDLDFGKAIEGMAGMLGMTEEQSAAAWKAVTKMAGLDPGTTSGTGGDIGTIPDPAIRRAWMAKPALDGSRVLWIESRPDQVSWEKQALEELGVTVHAVRTTKDALEQLHGGTFDLILSDVHRDGDRSAGTDALPYLQKIAPDLPVIFYVPQLNEGEETPLGATGITDQPDELLHLVLDQVERGRI